MTYSQWEYGLTLTGDGRRSSMTWLKTDLNCNFACADPEGDLGSGPPPPPRKSQVIWVSLNIMIRTPPPPLEKNGPPPPPGKCQTPSGSLEKYSFLCNQTIGPPL